MRLLYVGRISREKDLDILAAAYRQLRESGLPVTLCFVGDGPYSTALAEALPEEKFRGYRTCEELATIYDSADICCFRGHNEPFGNVFISSQGSGLRVLVSYR